MNITDVTPGGFANGFDNFCTNCGVFFSAQIMDADGCCNPASHCPRCGEDILITTIVCLLVYCADHHTDPVNFYTAFPLNEPIPQSRTGATPRQVKIIVSLVALDRQGKRPVSVESVVAESGFPLGVVAAVFDELHITESGAAA
jgi:hypothetical protein